MKTILIATIFLLAGCDNITRAYTVCSRDKGDWKCTIPVEDSYFNIPKHDEQNKITCFRRPKLDRAVFSEWFCYHTPKGGLPMDFPLGYMPDSK
jgi:hypothetical protein